MPAGTPWYSRPFSTTRKSCVSLEVLRLMREGYSMREVAKLVGVSPGTVCADWRVILAEYHEETRRLEVERHDVLVKAGRLLGRVEEIDGELARRVGNPITTGSDAEEPAVPGVLH